MTEICRRGTLTLILSMICVLLSSCSPDPLGDADSLGDARKNVTVSDNSEGLLKGTRKIEITRMRFYLVNTFYSRCSKHNLALELKDKDEISKFLALLHKNDESPRLKIDDQRRRYDLIVAIYGTNNVAIDSVIYISRCHDDMVAWYESYARKDGAIVSWDMCGGGKTVNEMEGWLKEKKIDIWSKENVFQDQINEAMNAKKTFWGRIHSSSSARPSP
jgi:hypothetical protein